MAIRTLTEPKVARRRQRQRQNEWAKSLIGDIISLFIGLGSCYSFILIGDIHISEIILVPSLLLLLVLNSNRLRLRKRKIGVILTLMLLWLLGQIATDTYRATEMHDWMRGQANIIVFMLDLISFTILLKGNTRRQLAFLYGLAIGVLLSLKLQPGTELTSGEDAIKFIYSIALLYFVAATSCLFYQRGQYAIVGLLLLGDIGFNVIFNLRSLTLIIFVATCLILPIIPEYIGRVRILPPARTRARVFVIIGVALVSGAVIGKIMTTLAATGVLGYQAQQKNQTQTTAGWGILLGGRPEVIVSSRAVIDSPILGHGSWAKDEKYTRMLADIQNEYGGKVSETSITRYSNLIPAHSHLMNAWVDAGILGGAFWIYILVLTAKSILTAARSQLPLKPAYITLFVLLFWDIIFSPFGGLRRVTVSFFIVLICDVLDPDSPGRQMVTQTFANAQVPLHRRNLGRIAPHLRPGF
jgi:hypothetical protein